MMTVGHPATITPPCAVMSPMRAAGRKPIITVIDPFTITSGGPTQIAMSVTRAAGRKPINTCGQQGGMIGPPTCGTGGVPGVTMGHVCMSVILAAGGMDYLLFAILPIMEVSLAVILLRHCEIAALSSRLRLPAGNFQSARRLWPTPRHYRPVNKPASLAG